MALTYKIQYGRPRNGKWYIRFNDDGEEFTRIFDESTFDINTIADKEKIKIEKRKNLKKDLDKKIGKKEKKADFEYTLKSVKMVRGLIELELDNDSNIHMDMEDDIDKVEAKIKKKVKP